MKSGIKRNLQRPPAVLVVGNLGNKDHQLCWWLRKKIYHRGAAKNKDHQLCWWLGKSFAMEVQQKQRSPAVLVVGNLGDKDHQLPLCPPCTPFDGANTHTQCQWCLQPARHCPIWGCILPILHPIWGRCPRTVPVVHAASQGQVPTHSELLWFGTLH